MSEAIIEGECNMCPDPAEFLLVTEPVGGYIGKLCRACAESLCILLENQARRKETPRGSRLPANI